MGKEERLIEWLRVHSAYWVEYVTMDLGGGKETGWGEFIYRGPTNDGTGKHTFSPVNGGPDHYFFPEEIKTLGQKVG